MRAKVGKGAEARWHALMTAVALEATRVTMAARWRRVKQAAKVRGFSVCVTSLGEETGPLEEANPLCSAP